MRWNRENEFHAPQSIAVRFLLSFDVCGDVFTFVTPLYMSAREVLWLINNIGWWMAYSCAVNYTFNAFCHDKWILTYRHDLIIKWTTTRHIEYTYFNTPPHPPSSKKCSARLVNTRGGLHLISDIAHFGPISDLKCEHMGDQQSNANKACYS